MTVAPLAVLVANVSSSLTSGPAEDSATTIDAVDTLWVLLAAVLVFFMQAGFALLEVGAVSGRNTQNILFKNLMDATLGAVLFWFVGYTIAYGTGCEVAEGCFGSDTCIAGYADYLSGLTADS